VHTVKLWSIAVSTDALGSTWQNWASGQTAFVLPDPHTHSAAGTWAFAEKPVLSEHAFKLETYDVVLHLAELSVPASLQ
jgi:hypothetical protein